MDPVTHGIAGALIGKAFFAKESSQEKPKTARVAIFAATLGAIFPDVDILVVWFSHDPLALQRYHRGFTHSFIGLPIFAAALAWLTRAFFRRYARRPGSGNWASPSFAFLFAAYAAGIASHILLDGFTSFGTRMLNPFSKDRVAWDLLFIVDFTFTALVLVPQVAAWVHHRREGSQARGTAMWVLLTLLSLGAWTLARAAQFAFPIGAFIIASGIVAVLFLFPIRGRATTPVPRRGWCRAGFYVSCAYIVACGMAHHAAMARVRAFAASHHLAVENIGALPLPPSLLEWSGLILTREGVYESKFSLRDAAAPKFQFWHDSPQNRYTQITARLEPVRTYLWYARFPVMHFGVVAGNYVVQYADMRFLTGENRPMPFTFYVSLDSEGKMLAYGRGAQLARVPPGQEP